MVTGRQLRKYGLEESREHHIPYKQGKKTALDHLTKYGDNYYKVIEPVEKRLLKQKKK
jgi:hypothetical protein